MAVVDQALYYAYEVESHGDDANSGLIALLDQVDQVVSTIHARSPRAGFARLHSKGNHWTCARDSPRPRGRDEYQEGGNCNYIALTVQVRLVKYVRAKLAANPAHLRNPSRPLLDYALRPYPNDTISCKTRGTKYQCRTGGTSVEGRGRPKSDCLSKW
jgi:hypothetical protein